MRTRLLLIVTLLFTSLASRAQTLENTVWHVSYMGIEAGYFMFEDGIWLFQVGNSWVPFGEYTVSGNIFTVTQPNTAISDCQGTGTYSYTITGDQLFFTLIDEPCTDRVDVFVLFDWVSSFPTGIVSREVAPVFEIHPNPSNGEFRVTQSFPDQLEINVYDVTGELVHQERYHALHNQLDLGALAKGTYVLRCISSNGSATRKIVIE